MPYLSGRSSVGLLKWESGATFPDYRHSSRKREVAIRIIKAQEDERRRVARDLHDGLAQQLAGAILGLEVAQKLLEDNSQRAKRELISVEQIIRSGLRETREVIFNLRPLSLDNLGLQAAVGNSFLRFKNGPMPGYFCQYMVKNEKLTVQL